ncbi:MAG: alpha-beta hydrolase superfamily lysophospholipase [Paracoccaceae bacterium]|jgi:alpha-beta hydrolase superfamily lysophospholipase
MPFVNSSLDSPTGAKINLYSMMPTGRVKAVVQINHGMAEHAARYVRFAVALTAAGFAVFAHDHRGHGATKAPDAPLGVFGAKNGFDLVIEDVLAVNSFIKDRDPETPVICFGHSMGSIIALNFAMQYPHKVAGLACWNAGVETGALAAASKFILGSEKLFRGRNSASKIAGKLTFAAWNNEFKPNRTDFDWLSRDSAEVDKYVADPLCGFPVSIGLWLDLLHGVYFGAEDRNLKALARALPVNILGGGNDPCSNRADDMEHLATRMRNAGMTDVSDVKLADTRHESLNEVNRDQTTANFITWLEKRFA